MKHQTRMLRCLAGILFLMVASTGVLRAADPQPLVVWTATPWQALTADMQPPAEPSLALKLVAARGGIASGLVVVSGAPGAVEAKAEDLKSEAGGVIPVRLRYATRKRDLGPATGFMIAGVQLDTSVQLGQSLSLIHI